MALVWVGLMVGCLACAVGLLRLSARPARCPTCRIPAEPLTRETDGLLGPVAELAYWCPRCARVVARRYLSLLCE